MQHVLHCATPDAASTQFFYGNRTYMKSPDNLPDTLLICLVKAGAAVI
jgi:hypothetical protein